MCRLIYESAFPGYADSCKGVIASDHPTRHVCGTQLPNCGRRSGLEFVLEDNEPQECETALRLLASESLRLQPCETLDALARDGYNTVSSLCVVREKVIVVIGN